LTSTKNTAEQNWLRNEKDIEAEIVGEIMDVKVKTQKVAKVVKESVSSLLNSNKAVLDRIQTDSG
jgi:hypothetical protein